MQVVIFGIHVRICNISICALLWCSDSILLGVAISQFVLHQTRTFLYLLLLWSILKHAIYVSVDVHVPVILCPTILLIVLHL
jgi:hypothetical protein